MLQLGVGSFSVLISESKTSADTKSFADGKLIWRNNKEAFLQAFVLDKFLPQSYKGSKISI
jgi:hypothetical protein